MGEFFASLAQEIETLQRNVFNEHARVLDQLRPRQLQLNASCAALDNNGTLPSIAEDAPSIRFPDMAEVRFPEVAEVAPARDTAILKFARSSCLEQKELLELVAETAAEIQMDDTEMQMDDTAEMQRRYRLAQDAEDVDEAGSQIFRVKSCRSVQFQSSIATSAFSGWTSAANDENRSEVDYLVSRSSIRVLNKFVPREEWELSNDLLQSASQEDEGVTMRHSKDEMEAECHHLMRTVRNHRLLHRSSKSKISPENSGDGRSDKGSIRSSRGVGGSTISLVDSEDERRAYWSGILSSLAVHIPFSPHSRQRLAWDMLGMVLVLYEMLTIPVLLLVIPSTDRFSKTLDLIFNVYWSLDVAITFLTCVERDGELNSDFLTIARNYAKTWLVIDLVMVLPEWFFFFYQTGNRAGLSALRFLKFTRMLRLLRVLKMENAIRKQLGRINSTSVLNLLNLSQMIVAFFFLNHFIACTWFFIGQAVGNGWVMRREAASGGEDVSEGYTLALHWAVAQFHGTAEVFPGNVQERIFAVIMQVIGLLTLSLFVSAITNVAMQERLARKRLYERRENLRMYFLQHKVPAELMLSVKGFLKAATNENEWMDDLEVLKGIPRMLQKSVLLEARSPTIETHCLFWWLNDRHKSAFGDICYSAFITARHLDGTVVFEEGDSWEKLIFVEEGHVRYIEGLPGPAMPRKSRRSVKIQRSQSLLRRVGTMHVGVRVNKKSWICELALWVQGWQNKGDFISVSNSSTICTHSAALTQVLNKFPAARLDVVMYVQGLLTEIIAMGLDPCMLNDMWQPR